MSERWARCIGFPAYEVSARGAVRQRHTRREISAWPNDEGYLYVNVQARGKWFKRRVHKLVWRAFRGAVPAGQEIDHRNRVRNDPRLSNLRLATRSQQLANSNPVGAASAFKGVTWCKARDLYQAQIKQYGVNHFLGRFKSEEKAARAYDRAARRLFGKFAVTNFGRK